jgi:hypothetical protein
MVNRKCDGPLELKLWRAERVKSLNSNASPRLVFCKVGREMQWCGSHSASVSPPFQ